MSSLATGPYTLIVPTIDILVASCRPPDMGIEPCVDPPPRIAPAARPRHAPPALAPIAYLPRRGKLDSQASFPGKVGMAGRGDAGRFCAFDGSTTSGDVGRRVNDLAVPRPLGCHRGHHLGLFTGSL